MIPLWMFSTLGTMNKKQNITVGHPIKPNDLYQLLYHFIDSAIGGFTYNGKSNSEDDITLAMSYYLDSKSEESSNLFKFINQAHRADIGVFFGRYYDSTSIDKQLCWIEAKRLPTPINSSRDEREYVFVDHSFKGNGGIERFKLNKHGEGLPVAMMLGYVQSNTFEYWEEKVNQWLQKYSSIVQSYQNERLIRINGNTNRYQSIHLRIDYKSNQQISDIIIYHFWITV